MDHIGAAIQSRRRSLGMSVQELADQAQISASYLYAMEAGTRGNHFDKIVRIAEVLQLDLYELAELSKKSKNSVPPMECRLFHLEMGGMQ